MKKHEVKVGGRYVAKVSDKLTLVRIDRENPHGGWDATNEKTGKALRIKSAQRLRSAVRDHAKQTAEVLGRGRQAAEAKAAGKAATSADGPRSDAEATKDTEAALKTARAATGGAKGGDKKAGCLDAAVQVLKTAAGGPMGAKEMVERMLAKGLWQTKGKTPAATLYAAIIREIAAKGGEARFHKAARGQFELSAAARE